MQGLLGKKKKKKDYHLPFAIKLSRNPSRRGRKTASQKIDNRKAVPENSPSVKFRRRRRGEKTTVRRERERIRRAAPRRLHHSGVVTKTGSVSIVVSLLLHTSAGTLVQR